MRKIASVCFGLLLAILIVLSVSPAKERTIYLRHVLGIVAGQQNYFALDEQIWAHTRRDLGDLRLYAGDKEVPYALTVWHGSASGQRTDVRLLNIGSVNGETQFDIDMMGAPEYDEVELRLADSARDFVTRAHIAGLDNLSTPPRVDLGTSVIFDFTHEGLGSGLTLKFPSSAFRYLRVNLPQITPDQVLSAIAVDTHKFRSFWTPVSAELPVEQVGRTTVVAWDASEQVPVARVVFDVDPSQTNFWRDIEVLTPSGGTVTNSSVRRIHIARSGNLVDTESLAVELPYESWGAFKMVIENGDGAPLKITAAKGYFYERRVYFEPGANTDLDLFYGNPGLGTPAYPYAKPIHIQEDAAVASLGLDMRNSTPEGALSPTAGANGCPVTPHVADYPAGGPRGNGDWYANADRTIWATFWGWDFVRRGPDEPDPKTGYVPGQKVLWYKPNEYPITVTGRRIDTSAPPMVYDISIDPRTRGLIQPSRIYFPTNGCWEVNATAGTSELHFVVFVKSPTP
jgi:hypothetical protein